MLLTEIHAELAKLLSWFVSEVEANSAMSHADISDASATFLLELFRELFDLPTLRNLNAEKANFPGIDLGDDATGKAFQITADGSLKKVVKTLKVSLSANVHGKYPHIRVFITTNKQRSYKKETIDKVTAGQISFSPKTDILDYKDILKLIQNLPPTKAEKILRIVRDHVRLPTAAPTSEAAQALERDMSARFQAALAKVAFPESHQALDLFDLAEEVLNQGTGSILSEGLRHDILIRAARAAALRKRPSDADKFLDAAQSISGSMASEPAQALIAEARGDTDRAFTLLRDRQDRDSISTFVGIMSRVKGVDAAYNWILSEKIDLAALPPHNLLQLCMIFIAKGKFDDLRAALDRIPQDALAEAPAALFFRGVIRLVSVFPKMFQSFGLSSPPFHLAFAQPVLDGTELTSRLDGAIDDLTRSFGLIQSLSLPRAESSTDWYLMWAKLVHPTRRVEAKAKLAADMQVMLRAVQRLQLAFRYLEGFDRAPIRDYLRRREATGGLSDDDLLASLTLGIETGDHTALAELLSRHRARYEEILGPEQAGVLEIQALCQANEAALGRARLEVIRPLLNQKAIVDIEAEISRAEGADPVVAYLHAYEREKSAASLRALVSELVRRKSYELLGQYAERLYEETQDPTDIALAAKAYAQVNDIDDFIRVVRVYPIVIQSNIDVKQRYAWILMQLGRLQEAQEIAEEFRDAGRRDLALEINLAIETGEWDKLAGPLAGYLDNVDAHDGLTLIRAAQTALVSGYGPYRELVTAAVSKHSPSAQVLLGAYTIAVEGGLEETDSRAHDWFRRAVELSGPEGPVQRADIKDLLDKQVEWSRHSRQVNDALQTGDLPIIVAAPQLRTTVVEALLGNFVRNEEGKDARKRTLLPLFSGRRTPIHLEASKRIALDITSLLVLGHVGLLTKVLQSFERVVIPAGVMQELFSGQRGVKESQRSLLKRSMQLRSLLATSVKVVQPPGGIPSDLTRAVGIDLSSLLEAARASGGIVVRPAPVMKLGSQGQELADLSAYSDCLCDTSMILSVLKDAGVLDEAAETLATRYFSLQDRGWPQSARPQKDKPLYLDDVAVSYLQTTELLDKVVENFDAVYITESAANEARDFLSNDRYAAEVVDILRNIREAVSTAFRAGTLSFSGLGSGAEEGDLKNLSTMRLLSELGSVDTVVIDDRALNKNFQILPREAIVVRVATTLDILEELRRRETIRGDEWRGFRHRLRRMGASLIDLESEEVRTAALRSIQAESAEFREISNSISLSRVRKMPRFPAEIPWFIAVSGALRTGLKEIWLHEPNGQRAAALSDLVLSILPRGEDWVAIWEGEISPNWVRAANRASIASLALALELPDPKVRTGYLDWLTRRVLKELQVVDPDLYQEIIEQLRSAISINVDTKRE
jgi:SMEK domain